jgi:hypothetical protein
MSLHTVPILVLLVAPVVQPLMWNREDHKFFVAVCGTNVQTGSVGSFIPVAKSMNLDVGYIGADQLSVDLEV